MSTDSDPTQQPETNNDVAEGVTNEPRGTGEVDEEALQAGEDRLEQAGGGH